MGFANVRAGTRVLMMPPAAAAAAGLEDYDFMGQCDDLFALRRLMRKPGTEVVSDLPCNVTREGG